MTTSVTTLPIVYSPSDTLTKKPMQHSSKLLWWLVGIVSTITLGTLGGALSTQRTHGEHIAVLEAQINEIRSSQIRLELNQTRQDNKLDRLLLHIKPD